MPDFDTGPGERCPNLSSGCTACGIYETRPQSCRQFECLWLQGFGSESERPDRSRVMIATLKDGLAVLWLLDGRSADRKLPTWYRKWIRLEHRGGRSVMVIDGVHGERVTTFHPNGTYTQEPKIWDD